MIDFFEFSNEMLCLADQRGYFTRVNPAWTRTLGWSAEELTSRPYIEFVHPDDLEATLREAELLQSGNHEIIWFENRYRCRDGSYRWLAWRVTTMPTLNQLAASARDITELKRQTEALRQAEERFRLLAFQAPVGIAQSDAEGKTFFVNKKWCEIAGAEPEEAMGYGWKRFLHPDDQQRLIAEWQAAMVAGQNFSISEFRFVHKDGAVRWASVTASPVKDADGRPIGQIGCVQDIHERKAMETALQESEDRFRAFMDHIPAMAWAKDEQGRFVYINRAFEERAHLRRNEWLGKTDFEVWPEEIARGFWETDRKVLAGGEPMQVTEQLSSAGDDGHFWFKTKFLFHDSRNRRFVGGVAIDVTELKRTEQSLRIEQDLLRNLLKVQENEKQFLCHEFHDGLIQYAVASLMLLERFRIDPPSPPDFSKIDAAIENLSRGIEDGRRVIRGIRPAVLDDLGIEAAIDDLIGQFADSGILVTSRCDPQIGRLPDSLQTTVYRVVQEALNNAKKYSGTDVVRIELKKADGDLLVEIRDFGCGFDAASARKRGFGLLGMTERVRLLGGECLIQSERDVGTRISVRLPIPA